MPLLHEEAAAKSLLLFASRRPRYPCRAIFRTWTLRENMDLRSSRDISDLHVSSKNASSVTNTNSKLAWGKSNSCIKEAAFLIWTDVQRNTRTREEWQRIESWFWPKIRTMSCIYAKAQICWDSTLLKQSSMSLSLRYEWVVYMQVSISAPICWVAANGQSLELKWYVYYA